MGYKPFNDSPRSTFLYKTLNADVDNDLKTELILDELHRKTKYQIVVQAFNSKGSGLLSEQILAETLHEGESLDDCYYYDYHYFDYLFFCV